MFKIKDLTVKNFMSVGNATQAVNFNRQDLTLVLGENLDLGGDDSGARNGTGKTTILNALSYALYGEALTKIRKDNLINKTNSKGMMVTLDFAIGGNDYRVERGRKPNTFKFYVNAQEQEMTDESQGDSRETQAEVERLLRMSHEMFKHVVALNTYTEPFLSLRANDQRALIEQLLGITILSDKAEKLKDLQRATKEAITEEEYRIKAVTDANVRIEQQIDSLRKRQRLWYAQHDETVTKLTTGIADLSKIDIDNELVMHNELDKWNEKEKTYNEAERWLASAWNDTQKQQKLIDRIDKEIALLEEHKCHSCGQDIHDEKQDALLKSKEKSKKTANDAVIANSRTEEEHAEVMSKHKNVGDKPSTFYPARDGAIEHKNNLANLETQLENKAKEQDPYGEQVDEMETAGIEQISYDTLNELVNIKEHQEFLMKLLTNKDSFIRKRIIDQNLSFLNARLHVYLDKIGLPHQVKFLNDLNVEITELGRDLDFDNLSRGERNRLILSLSWAFRDVWESLYHPINLLFIDELVDSGMDSSGVENALSILKKMSRESNRSVWLVSHKDELAGRVNNTLHVVKENGFTSYNTDVDIV
jgi:DNA repair exonuclease SbcCD ATPase subunit